jgi:hypothetical protein
MSRLAIALISVVLLASTGLFAQGTPTKRNRGTTTTGTGIYDVPAVTFEGKVKTIDKKELRIDAGVSGEDSLIFRITHRTHFLKDGKEIKPTDVAPGTPVAVDAYREPDQKFSALNVVVNPPKPKTADQ